MTCSRTTVSALLAVSLALLIAAIKAPGIEAKTAEGGTPASHRAFALPAGAQQAAGAASQSAGSTPQAAGGNITLPDGKGKEVVQRVCTGCHSVNMFASQRHTNAQWDELIASMVSKGLTASDDDLNTISNYLGTYLGPQAPSPATPPSPPSSNSPH